MSRVFSNSTDVISISDSASLQTMESGFSLMCWVKYSIGNWLVVIGPANWQGGLLITSNALEGFGQELTFAVSVSSTVIPTDIWSHVACTWSTSDHLVRLYLNGSECAYQDQIVGSGALQPFTGVGIGNILPAAAALVGSIAEVKMYNKVLTSEQIALCAQNQNPLIGNQVAYLPLYGINNTEPDISGNSNAGTVTGAIGGPYNVIDSRITRNASALVNGAQLFNQNNNSSTSLLIDCRAAGAPIACGTYPQNSRTPGTYGPGE